MAESETNAEKVIPEWVEQTGELVDQPEAGDAEIPVIKEVASGDDLVADASSMCECPVCHEDYVNPKILPCGHLVCEKCVLSWMDKEGLEASCPLCRACILSPDLEDSVDLDSEVNALPTDLYTAALVESHQVLQGPHICSLCENDVVAVSYCIPCGIKLCTNCVKSHKKVPATKTHSPEDLDSLSIEKLVENQPVMCKTHPDRVAEVYCPEHQEVICLLCSTTSHGSCADRKTVADVGRDTKAELDQQIQNLKLKGKELENQVKNAKDHFKTLRKKVKDTFDDLQQMLDTQRQTFNDNIQAEEDLVMISLSEIEKTRAALTQNATTIGHLTQSASGAALLQMLKALKERLDFLEEQAEETEEPNPAEFVLDLQKLQGVKEEIAGLDDCRAAATLSYTFENISKLEAKGYSPPYMIRGLPWIIYVGPSQNTGHQKTLGFGLKLEDATSQSELWSCNAMGEYRLLSTRPDTKPYCRSPISEQRLFCNEGTGWGLRDFISWDEMMDPENGYVQDDKITVEVYIEADAPRRTESGHIGHSQSAGLIET